MRTVASEFLRAVRGRRSQRAFARRLGYRANPITDWENERRFPTAREALRACARTGTDVVAAFARFHARDPLERERRGFAIGRWLDRLRGKASIATLAARSGRSRFAVGRVLSEQAEPRLPDFFALVDAITGRLPDLVAELVPIEAVPSLVPRYAASRAARSAAFTEPWTEAILRVLETESYTSRAHVPGYIAERLGVSLEVEERGLAILESANIVRRKGGRWVTSGELTVETGNDAERLRRLRTHWAEVNLARAMDPREGDGFAYNVVSLSARDLDRVRELLRVTFRQIRTIVAASQPPQSVALLTLQIATFDRESDGG
jgi:transcriptional regulator with XRE-family HTH domain